MTQKQMMDEFIKLKKEGKPFRLGGPGFLQEFADGDDQGDDSDDDGGDDDGDDGDDGQGDDQDGDDDGDIIEYSKGTIDQIMASNKIDFAQLLKDNPQLKKEYTARFNTNMSKRLKSFEGVDIEEYKDLKARADAGNLEGDAKTWKEKYDNLQIQMTETSKSTAIQAQAIDNGFDSEQIAFISSMINLSKVERDDDDGWLGIDDEIERIQAKFPRMFETASDDDDTDNEDKKKSKYNPGKKKHNQDSKTTDPKEKGRLKAMERNAKRNKK